MTRFVEESLRDWRVLKLFTAHVHSPTTHAEIQDIVMSGIMFVLLWPLLNKPLGWRHPDNRTHTASTHFLNDKFTDFRAWMENLAWYAFNPKHPSD